MTLLELATRCETAEGPDRALDAEIALTQGWTAHAGDNWIGPLGQICVSPWTGSIDAALSLVPEGWAWSVVYERERELSGKPPFFADARNGYRSSYDQAPMAWAATPALALCAAALKARAAIGMETRSDETPQEVQPEG
jgi:hypothetical protein